MLTYWFPVTSFLVCFTLTPIVRRIARKRGWIAQPTKDRWHKNPTALAGGIAIYAAISIPLFIISDFETLLPHFFGNSTPTLLPAMDAVIWIGITFLFLFLACQVIPGREDAQREQDQHDE